MLDKSVPYKNIIMKIPADKIENLREPVLPEGFSFACFQKGSEKDWARIETSVLEFDSEDAAKRYFVRDYLPHKELLKTRCFFVVNPEKIPVATATAWFAVSPLGYQPSLHWVGVSPGFQGLGLGKAIIIKATKHFLDTDPGADVILHTQTWSHKAVKIYHDLGFNMLKSGSIAIMCNDKDGTKIPPNDYEEALTVLRGKLNQETYNGLIRNALER